MTVAVQLLLWVVALLALSGVGVYLYGRFARRTMGEPAQALPVEADATALDRFVAPQVKAHGGQSGLSLSTDSLHAFAVRATSARMAGRSLDLQYYYWKDDLTGSLLAAEVLDAADRGVRVRLLLDDINLKGRDAKYLSLSQHEMIEVRVFNPCWNRVGALQRGIELVLRAWSATRRMHNKSWIADNRVAIVGGRNIGDPYFDAAEAMNFRDMDLVTIGPVVGQASDIFDRFWNSNCVFPISAFPRIESGDLDWLRRQLGEIRASPAAQPYLQRVRESDAVEMLHQNRDTVHWTDSASVVSDPPAKLSGGKRHRWLYKAIFPLVTSATKSLEITSPYFIPGKEGVRQLTRLVGKGVKVSVLTNSLAATDVAAVHGAYAPYRKRLLRGGVHLYELKPDAKRQRMTMFGSGGSGVLGSRGGNGIFGSGGASLHTKAFTVDGVSGFVGSFNFDPRSVSLNTEMGVMFENEALAQQLSETFRQQISGHAAYQILLRKRRLFWKAGAAEWDDEPAATRWRRFVAALAMMLPVESQL